ncbi:hypothetical protein GOL41_31495 [Sinorhizobium medicae]|nr:hypothetical protein [Sinorhizobium medicae]MDX1219756.1 hypothetical protein [Sinorhizobium medicae]
MGEAIRVSSWLSRCNRLHLHIEQQRMRILTPRGHDWTHRFPAIEAAARNVNHPARGTGKWQDAVRQPTDGGSRRALYELISCGGLSDSAIGGAGRRVVG